MEMDARIGILGEHVLLTECRLGHVWFGQCEHGCSAVKQIVLGRGWFLVVPTTDAIHRNIICGDWVDHPLQKPRHLHARRSEERKAESREYDDDCFTCELRRLFVAQLCHFNRNWIVF